MENGGRKGMENGGGKGKTKGRRWRKQQKNKKGKKEERKARVTKEPRLLFIEFNKILYGINLNLDSTYLYDHAAAADSPNIKEPPPLVPTFCRLNLSKDRFLRHGVHHIKIKSSSDDDEVYLVGGGVHEEKSASFVNYSDKVYKFDYCKFHCDDNINFSSTKQVLIPLSSSSNTTTLDTTLYEVPLISLVANLNGTFYFLNQWESKSFHHDVPNIKIAKITTFKRFDPITHSFHQEPIPPYLDLSHPIFTHFVVDNKLVIISTGCVYIFHADANAWTRGFDLYELFLKSFNRRYYPYNDAGFPQKMFWISDFCFRSSGSSCSLFDSLTVFLAIRPVDCDSFDPKVHQFPEADPYSSFCYECTLQVHAYAMSKIDYQLHFYQKLDDVFSHLLPLPYYTPLNLLTEKHLFLDLGKGGEDGKQEGLRRICLIMTVEGLTNGISYLFVSIFDLRMKSAPYLKQEKNYNRGLFDKQEIMLDADDDSWPFLDEFLEIVCVKKRVFRLNQYINEEFFPLRNVWPLPPLDAFII